MVLDVFVTDGVAETLAGERVTQRHKSAGQNSHRTHSDLNMCIFNGGRKNIFTALFSQFTGVAKSSFWTLWESLKNETHKPQLLEKPQARKTRTQRNLTKWHNELKSEVIVHWWLMVMVDFFLPGACCRTISDRSCRCMKRTSPPTPNSSRNQNEHGGLKTDTRNLLRPRRTSTILQSMKSITAPNERSTWGTRERTSVRTFPHLHTEDLSTTT